jgi:hypothetical protein
MTLIIPLTLPTHMQYKIIRLTKSDGLCYVTSQIKSGGLQLSKHVQLQHLK